MEKFALILSVNGEVQQPILVDSIEKIDEFIMKNNIFDVESLFNYVIKDEQKSNNSEYSFEIYSMEKKKKKLPILYKDDIYGLTCLYYSMNDLGDRIFKKVIDDSDFSLKFYNRYVFPLTNISEEQNDKKIIALNLLKYYHQYNKTKENPEQFTKEEKRIAYLSYENAFRKFYYSLSGIENKKTRSWKSVYEAKRNFYVFYKYYNKTLSSSYYVHENKSIPLPLIDELEEQLLYGKNATEGLRVDGIKYRDFIRKQNLSKTSIVHDTDEKKGKRK